MLGYIVAFISGIVFGQEYNDLPRMKPLLQQGFDKFIMFSKDAINKYGNDNKEK